MLKVQRRHRPPCKRPMWDAGYTKCNCPVLIIGTLGKGQRVRAAAATYLTSDKAKSLDAANELARLWEKEGRIVSPAIEAKLTVVVEDDKEGDKKLITIEHAVKTYLADAIDRGVAEGTLSKKKTVFEKHLLTFAFDKGLRAVNELTLEMLRAFRSSWKTNELSRHKRQCSVLGFLWFCERAGWFQRNYASDITKGLGKIEVKRTQTGYFKPEEYQKLLDATALYSDRPGTNHLDITRDAGQRIRTVMELMRWTGLRIRDAVTLEKSRVTLDHETGMWSVFLYQHKTGEPVYAPIPPHVAQLLATVPASQKGNTNDTWFFWTGNGKPKTLATNWERSFARLFEIAGLKGPDGQPKRCFPHMLRDTFAVESLLNGVPLVDVSKMLGHASIKITEDHYLGWVRARQQSLNQSVMNSWAKQGVVNPPRGPGRPRKATVIPIAS